MKRILTVLALCALAGCNSLLGNAKLALGTAEVAHHEGAVLLETGALDKHAELKKALLDAEAIEDPAFEALSNATIEYIKADLRLDSLKAAHAAGEQINDAETKLKIATDALSSIMDTAPGDIQALIDAVSALKKKGK